MSDYGMVIIGGGEAGARAAVQLREQGYTGSVTLIGKENRPPYERPPLSKQALVAEDEPSPAVILDAEKLLQADIRFLSGFQVERIDRHNHSIGLEYGQTVRYERLLLATGAKPRQLTLSGSDTSEILYLRTFTDALALRAQLMPDKHIVVIGGGFIGLEVAASARERGCQVTLIEAAPRILMRGVPEEIARLMDMRHRAAGVEFKLGVGISGIARVGDGHRITLADGSEIHCNAVIAGIGAVPETSLAAECDLTVDNGISVDEYLATSDPDIFAAGDCCSFPHNLYGGKRIRLESYRNAQDQGIHAAGNMLGASARYEAVPWFWSDQYEQTLQVSGLPDCGVNTVKRDLGDENHLYFHLADDGRLVAASGLGMSISKDIAIAEMLIQQRATPDPAMLADKNVKLKTLLNKS